MKLLHHRGVPGTELGGQRPGTLDDPTTLPQDELAGNTDFDAARRASRRRKIGAWAGLGAVVGGGLLYWQLHQSASGGNESKSGSVPATASPNRPSPTNTGNTTQNNGGSGATVKMPVPKDPCTVMPENLVGTGCTSQSDETDVRATWPSLDILAQQGVSHDEAKQTLATDNGDTPQDVLLTADGHQYPAIWDAKGKTLAVEVGDYDLEVADTTLGAADPGLQQRLANIASVAIDAVW